MDDNVIFRTHVGCCVVCRLWFDLTWLEDGVCIDCSERQHNNGVSLGDLFDININLSEWNN